MNDQCTEKLGCCEAYAPWKQKWRVQCRNAEKKDLNMERERERKKKIARSLWPRFPWKEGVTFLRDRVLYFAQRQLAIKQWINADFTRGTINFLDNVLCTWWYFHHFQALVTATTEALPRWCWACPQYISSLEQLPKGEIFVLGTRQKCAFPYPCFFGWLFYLSELITILWLILMFLDSCLISCVFSVSVCLWVVIILPLLLFQSFWYGSWRGTGDPEG